MFWVVALVAVVLLYNFFKATSQQQEELTYSQFIKKVEDGAVAKVTIAGDETLEIEGEYRQEAGGAAGVKYFRTTALKDDKLTSMLKSSGVEITVKKAKESTYLITLMTWEIGRASCRERV